MNWTSFAAFADMGGYAFYVWGSYFVTAAVLALEAVALLRRRREALAGLRRRLDAGQEGVA